MALNNLLGLTAADDHWTIATGLSLPVATEDELAALQHMAEVSRLDLIAARGAVTVREDSLGVARSYRLVGDIAVGIDYERETDGSRLLGPSLGLTLPLFNWGSGKVERARAELEHARAEARQLELDISNGVRLAHAAVLSAREIVQRYRSSLIPQREAVVQHAAKLQNYMIIGQFEVLLAKQQEYEAYQSYLEALGQYWTARANLAGVVGARLPRAAQIAVDGRELSTSVPPPIVSGVAPAAPQTKMPDEMDMRGMDHTGAMPPPQPTPDAPPAEKQPSPPHGEHQH